MNNKSECKNVQYRTKLDETLVVRFNNGLHAAIIDRYCTDPNCICTAVSLEFSEVENRRFKDKLFSLRLDTETWEISDIRLDSIDLGIEGMIKEFHAGLTETLKERFKTKLNKAKEFGREGVLEWFDDVKDNNCFSYAEVFGDDYKENKKFIFDHKGLQFFVDDQYCGNPKCTCDEVILSFIEITEQEGHGAQFRLIVPLDSGDYEIESSKEISGSEIKSIFNRYMEHIHNDLSLFRSRYAEMKEFGRKRLLRKMQKSAPITATAKPGRNEPCHCGSGKKFKKCCGMGS